MLRSDVLPLGLGRGLCRALTGAPTLSDSESVSDNLYAETLLSVRAFKDERRWWQARQQLISFLEIAADTGQTDASITWAWQQLALCTYKDPEIRRADALEQALAYLNVDEPDQVADIETAGLVGAVHKRWWELDGREQRLRASLTWYERAAEIADAAPTYDAYGDVNAAFVAELLASIQPEGARREFLACAAQHRHTIRNKVAPTKASGWWSLASLLEAEVAEVGHDSDENHEWGSVRACVSALEEVIAEDPVSSWEIQTLATQVASIGTLLGIANEVRAEAVAPLMTLGSDAQRWLGRRLGVALSGGGFRASLFHFGVLAALADHDLLHRVTVLSCVSGGSIAGAAWYAALKGLLETDPPKSGDASDASDAVASALADCINRFAGSVTAKNLRMAAFLGPRTLVRNRFSRRNTRAGELFVRELVAPQDTGQRYLTLDDLLVEPADHAEGTFRPKTDNWSRTVCVPLLLLNATSLGTGRNFQCTAGWIGEPETSVEIDPLARLEPIWFDLNRELTDRLPTLGGALSASAGVPGLFPPLRLKGLYEDRAVALVDGGVVDNQGVTGLLDHDCTDVLVSDASGLLKEKKRPSWSSLLGALRSHSVSMNAVRSSSAKAAEYALQGGQVRNHRFVHMLQGLDPELVEPRQVESRQGNVPHPEPHPAPGSVELEDYAHPVNAEVQRALARLRTDLDRFSPAEAYGLMKLGYELTCQRFKDEPHPLQTDNRRRHWPWDAIDEWVEADNADQRLLGELQAGSKVFFKFRFGGLRNLSYQKLQQGPAVRR